MQDVPTAFPDDPKGLQFVLQYLAKVYGDLPIYVQENGKQNFQPESILRQTNKVASLIV